MRHLVEILRLKHQQHLSIREIARSCAVASSTVGDYLARAEAAQIRWPLPDGLTESELQARLFSPTSTGSQAGPARSTPAWTRIQP